MPTIDELPPAVSVADGDELVVSQSDTARKATRSQLLAGVQAQLAIPANSLLGRLSAGVGAPEPIAIGENLVAENGTLSGAPPFIIAGLTGGGLPSAIDQVPLAQGGQNAQLSYSSFMSGLSSITGIDGSGFSATPTGAGISRKLADFFGDAEPVENFGAVGDGETDDTDAFIAAISSGRPIRLDGRVYIVNGPLSLSTSTAILGVTGLTVIRRNKLLSAMIWITITAPSFHAAGVIFDAANINGADFPAVAIGPDCLDAGFSECGFSNTVGTENGHGLSVNGGSGGLCSVVRCTFVTNGCHGLYAQGLGVLVVDACRAVNNAASGLRVEATLACALRQNDCVGNANGISVGNWNSGPAMPQAGPSCALDQNSCSANSYWGIAVAAGGAQILGNVCQANGTVMPGGGLLARVGASRVTDNIISQGNVGIDARGCWGSMIAANHVSNATIGLTVGGSVNLSVHNNTLLGNGWGVVVSAIEPSLSAVLSDAITIASNWIGFTTAQGGGISVLDAAQGIAVIDNDINGWGSATNGQALWIHTDQLVQRGNRWNNQARYTVQTSTVAGLNALVVADTADEVLVTSAPLSVDSVMTDHQADTLGEIVFVKVTNGGTGYTLANVNISGTGIGAAANAIVENGQVVWIIVRNSGSGYGPIGTGATVSIIGDGAGATATAYVGLPVPEGRQLRLSCNCQLQLALAGSSPLQQSWTEYASTVPAFGSVDLEGVAGGWRAVTFPPVDYLSPTGSGGVILQSQGGSDITFRPSSGGAVHFSSAVEGTGCTSSVGRGSPLGAVSAPPGSDFRNLNGGPGNTFWIKQQNVDATGWVPIA